jgi:hypothetical protein
MGRATLSSWLKPQHLAEVLGLTCVDRVELSSLNVMQVY